MSDAEKIDVLSPMQAHCKAINPAHQNPGLPINFNIKMNLVRELSDALRKMGKRINVSYF